jgi:hypothetical protein
MNTVLTSTDLHRQIENLIQNRYVLFTPKFSLAGPGIKEIINTFIGLTKLPKSKRSQWAITTPGDREADDGLIERNGGAHDHKFFFHYRDMERLLPYLKERGLLKKDAQKHERFLAQLKTLHRNLSQDMEKVVDGLDASYPDFKIKERVQAQDKTSRGVLRLLYYKPGNEVLAKAHYDQSFLTFQVAESDPGLTIEGKKVSPVHGKIILFPGIKAQMVTDAAFTANGASALTPQWQPKSVISAARHSAVSNGVTKEQGRWSIVFFYHCDVGIPTEQVSAIAKKQITLLQ